MEETFALTQNVGKQLLAEDVFHHLGTAIADGTFAPGERLRDADLAAQYNVSRTPVREALQRLERIGMVEMAPSRFTRVTEPSAKDIDDARVYAGYQSGILCAMAIPNLTEPARDRALELIEETKTAPPNRIARSRANWALFDHLADSSGNSVHRTLTSEPRMALLRLLRLWEPTDEQRAIVQNARTTLPIAIRSGDGRGAELSARGLFAVT
jgi:DNA-binding GntR family transcriptional regulator